MINHRRLRDILPVPIPAPFDASRFVADLAAARGRRIVVHPMTLPTTGALCGLSVAEGNTDHILVAADTPTLHHHHVLLHELAHILLDHRSHIPTTASLALAPELVERVLGRTPRDSYTDTQEREAEDLATTIAVHAATRTGRTGRAGAMLRWSTHNGLFRAMHPLWHALHEIQPGIALEPPTDPTVDAPLPTRGSLRALYRRVIEIQDGARLAARYLDETVTADVDRLVRHAGLPTQQATATSLGGSLAIALRLRREDPHRKPTARQSPAGMPAPDDDVLSCARVLALASQAFHRWPLIGSPTAHA
ncbi:DUF6545 domain-containing protein [Polymorphospora rubra]|uniref:DUF6545 domain-containing protein n=1 Tax=Polymorphospora rubra TaxID=338584 RepID=A0A810MNT3_9ACTN|nr:DUF6545 domain-containing protein [Polymorphospora rubra]BCJ62986.1 hypothetical protein Prubr_00070 [Polymorphospora rubra]